MKRFILLLAVGCLSFSAFAQNSSSPAPAATSVPASLEIGASVPMAQTLLINTNKDQISLEKAMTGKGLLVMFSCNTCPYVVKSQARTREVMQYASAKGVGMVIVNSNTAKRDGDDSFDEMVRYAKEQGYTVSYLVDENNQLADAFGATRTPEVYLFNGSGKLVYKGAMEDNPSEPSASTRMYLKEAITNMLSNKKINPATTKSIGCSIKRG